MHSGPMSRLSQLASGSRLGNRLVSTPKSTCNRRPGGQSSLAPEKKTHLSLPAAAPSHALDCCRDRAGISIRDYREFNTAISRSANKNQPSSLEVGAIAPRPQDQQVRATPSQRVFSFRTLPAAEAGGRGGPARRPRGGSDGAACRSLRARGPPSGGGQGMAARHRRSGRDREAAQSPRPSLRTAMRTPAVSECRRSRQSMREVAQDAATAVRSLAADRRMVGPRGQSRQVLPWCRGS